MEAVPLPARKSDKERAEELKAELRAVLDLACAVITKAQSESITLSFQIGRDGLGRSVIAGLSASKEL